MSGIGNRKGNIIQNLLSLSTFLPFFVMLFNYNKEKLKEMKSTFSMHFK